MVFVNVQINSVYFYHYDCCDCYYGLWFISAKQWINERLKGI